MLAQSNHRYALIIGINDYRQFDGAGAACLRGSINNAKVYLDLARRTGTPDQNIQVLLGAVAQDDLSTGFGGLTHGRPDRDGILAGLRWLAERLREPGSIGLFAYSGHGIMRDGRLALCPADANGRFQNLISMTEVDGLFSPEAELTTFLDTCFAGAERAEDAVVLDRAALRTGVTIASCAANQTSAEYPFQGAWKGAFTGAFELLLQSPRRATPSMSAADVVSRTGQILDALAIPQRPIARAANAERLRMPVLAHDLPSTTPSHVLELSPGTTGPGFTIFTISGGATGSIVVIGDSNITVGGNTWKSNRAYWYTTSFTASFNIVANTGNGTTDPLRDFGHTPAQADRIYQNGVNSSNPPGTKTVSHVITTGSSTVGHVRILTDTSGPMGWYFFSGEQAAFTSAQQDHSSISFTAQAGTLTGTPTYYADNITSP